MKRIKEEPIPIPEEVPEQVKSNEDPFDLMSLEGVGSVTVKKLQLANIDSLYQLCQCSAREISDLTGYDLAKSSRVLMSAREIMERGHFLEKSLTSAADLLERRKNLQYIRTGSNDLDKFLGGGIEATSVTEVYGEFGCGKTQLCHTVAVNCVTELGKKVLYIDTENTFRPERIVDICKYYKLDHEKVLNEITVARAHDSGQQLQQLSGANLKDVGLIVIDSVMGNLRGDFIGRGALWERQGLLNKHLLKLKRLCEENKICGLITNQIMYNPAQAFGDPTKPIGGSILAHSSTYRIYFKKSGKKRVAKMVDSPSHPDLECLFSLGEAGIIDAIEEK